MLTKKNLLFLMILGCVIGGGFFIAKGFFFKKDLLDIPSQVRFGIVDLTRIRNESEPFKILRSFIEDRYNEANKMIFNSENEIRAEYKKLREDEKRAGPKGSADLLKKRQAFEKKVVGLEQMVQQKKQALNEQFMTISKHIEAELRHILEDLALKNNLKAILNRSVDDDVSIVLYASPQLDLTDVVIESLNHFKDKLQLPS